MTLEGRLAAALARPGWNAAALAAFVICFLALRTVNLTAMPIFVDEGMHLDWAFRMRETGRLLGVTDGGRYLPIVLYSLVAAPAADPLWVARMCSGVFGLVAALGLVELGRLLYTRAAGSVAAILCLVVPFCLFHDRMALVDSLLAAIVVLSLIFVTLWVRTARPAWAVALGVALGCAGATKLYGALLFALPPVALALLPGRATTLLRRQLLWVYAIALGLMLPVVAELGATAAFVAENLWVFRSDFQADPGFLTSLERTLAWHRTYLTPAGLTLAVLAAAHSLLGAGSRADRLLLGFWAAWCLFFVVAGGRNWFPRYLLPAIPPLLLFTAHWSLRLGALGACGLVGVFTLSSWSFDRAILTEPAAAPLPEIDRWQYVENWPAGYGLAETVGFLRGEVAARGRIVLLRDSLSGPLREGLDLALRRDRRRIEIVTLDLSGEAPEPAVVEKLLAQPHAVYLALEQPAERQLVLDLAAASAVGPVATFAKPAIVRHVEIYLVKEAQHVVARPASRERGESLIRDVQALGTMRRIEPLARGSALLHRQMASNLARLGRWKEAEVSFELSLSLDSSQDGVRNDLGVTLFMEGREQEAFRSWLAVRRRDHGGVRASYNLAVGRACRIRRFTSARESP